MTAPVAPRGATTARITWRQRLQSYREQHRDTARDSFQRLLARPVPSLMTVLVIAISLSLPGGLYLLLKNAQTLSDGWNLSPQVSLFLHTEVTEDQAQQLAKVIESRKEVARIHYLSRQQALAEFQEQSGLVDLLQGLDENPLPAVIVVYPVSAELSAVEGLRDDLASLGAVDRAQLDVEWIQKLQGLLTLGRRLVVALALGLAVAVLLVITNTIRLAVENRRDEIVIVKLVGGTDAFVRRPFMYTGLWLGLGGGLAALLLIQLLLIWLHGPVDLLSELYRSQFELTGLGVAANLLMVLCSGLLGLVGARLAVDAHIRSLDLG